jgi:hypothetical protein
MTHIDSLEKAIDNLKVKDARTLTKVVRIMAEYDLSLARLINALNAVDPRITGGYAIEDEILDNALTEYEKIAEAH